MTFKAKYKNEDETFEIILIPRNKWEEEQLFEVLVKGNSREIIPSFSKGKIIFHFVPVKGDLQ
jgi:hypothetical protein